MGSPFAVLIRRKPPNNASNVPLRTAAERNVRPPVEVFPQEAPDAPRYGDTPSRWAHMPVVTFRLDDPIDEALFVMPQLEVQRARNTPRGRQSPMGARTNITVPQHVAYGSLFTANPPIYGLG